MKYMWSFKAVFCTSHHWFGNSFRHLNAGNWCQVMVIASWDLARESCQEWLETSYSVGLIYTSRRWASSSSWPRARVWNGHRPETSTVSLELVLDPVEPKQSIETLNTEVPGEFPQGVWPNGVFRALTYTSSAWLIDLCMNMKRWLYWNAWNKINVMNSGNTVTKNLPV